jgi:hypothetical protein
MDEEPGSATASDLGTGGFPGTLQGGADFVIGKLGNALLLDGVDDSVVVGDHAVHDVDEFTFAAWIWIAAAPTVPHPSILAQGFNYRFRLEGITTQPGIAFHNENADQANDTGSVVCGGMALETETWYHVAATYQLEPERIVRVLVDGGSVCERSLSGGDGLIPDAPAELRIGRTGTTGAVFNGMIDDVRIYDRPLEPEEIQTLLGM